MEDRGQFGLLDMVLQKILYKELNSNFEVLARFWDLFEVALGRREFGASNRFQARAKEAFFALKVITDEADVYSCFFRQVFDSGSIVTFARKNDFCSLK